ncbi:MFS transporter [Chitinophaga pinensis]|uniref:MFS transporter n=1 Tax=Chitinophaga pinensis TaxID=79329 RepID=UPI0039658A87
MGIFGSFAATGSAAGLSVGGIIASYLGWSWVFLINVPILLIIIVIAYLYLEKDIKSQSKLPDIPAAIALVISMLSLTWATELLSKPSENGLKIAGLLFLLVAATGYLFKRLKTQAIPLLDLEVLSLPSLRKGNTLLSCWAHSSPATCSL